jgi:hypothetical protein
MRNRRCQAPGSARGLRKPPKAPEPPELLCAFVAESRRAEAARLDKERQQLAEIAAAQANIATEQARTARSQRITRWAFAAVGAIIVIAGAAVGYLQWDKARQLATKETEIAAEQASNAALRQSLNARQIALDTAAFNPNGSQNR